jgi:hypothetical protein
MYCDQVDASAFREVPALWCAGSAKVLGPIAPQVSGIAYVSLCLAAAKEPSDVSIYDRSRLVRR